MPPRAPDPSAASSAAHGGGRVGPGRPRVQKILKFLSSFCILPGMTSRQLIDLREKLGWPVAQLAEYLGVSHVTVHNWENGKHAVSNRRVRLLLEDLWDREYGAPWDRERARLEVAKRLGTDADRSGSLLVEYGRAPGESWRSVVSRVVDGERFRKVGRVAEA